MAATKTTKKKHEDQDTANSLLDMSQSSVKKMMAQAKTRGYITYDELNEFMPPEQVSSEQIEDVMDTEVNPTSQSAFIQDVIDKLSEDETSQIELPENLKIIKKVAFKQLELNPKNSTAFLLLAGIQNEQNDH